MKPKTLLLAMALSIALSASAQLKAVRIDVQCHDAKILHEIQKQAYSAIEESKKARIVSDGSAQIILRIVAQPVPDPDKPDGPPSGVSIAAVISRVHQPGREEVLRVTNQLHSYTLYASAAKKIVADSLK